MRHKHRDKCKQTLRRPGQHRGYSENRFEADAGSGDFNSFTSFPSPAMRAYWAAVPPEQRADLLSVSLLDCREYAEKRLCPSRRLQAGKVAPKTEEKPLSLLLEEGVEHFSSKGSWKSWRFPLDEDHEMLSAQSFRDHLYTDVLPKDLRDLVPSPEKLTLGYMKIELEVPDSVWSHIEATRQRLLHGHRYTPRGPQKVTQEYFLVSICTILLSASRFHELLYLFLAVPIFHELTGGSQEEAHPMKSCQMIIDGLDKLPLEHMEVMFSWIIHKMALMEGRLMPYDLTWHGTATIKKSLLMDWLELSGDKIEFKEEWWRCMMEATNDGDQDNAEQKDVHTSPHPILNWLSSPSREVLLLERQWLRETTGPGKEPSATLAYQVLVVALKEYKKWHDLLAACEQWLSDWEEAHHDSPGAIAKEPEELLTSWHKRVSQFCRNRELCVLSHQLLTTVDVKTNIRTKVTLAKVTEMWRREMGDDNEKPNMSNVQQNTTEQLKLHVEELPGAKEDLSHDKKELKKAREDLREAKGRLKEKSDLQRLQLVNQANDMLKGKDVLKKVNKAALQRADIEMKREAMRDQQRRSDVQKSNTWKARRSHLEQDVKPHDYDDVRAALEKALTEIQERTKNRETKMLRIQTCLNIVKQGQDSLSHRLADLAGDERAALINDLRPQLQRLGKQPIQGVSNFDDKCRATGSHDPLTSVSLGSAFYKIPDLITEKSESDGLIEIKEIISELKEHIHLALFILCCMERSLIFLTCEDKLWDLWDRLLRPLMIERLEHAAYTWCMNDLLGEEDTNGHGDGKARQSGPHTRAEVLGDRNSDFEDYSVDVQTAVEMLQMTRMWEQQNL